MLTQVTDAFFSLRARIAVLGVLVLIAAGAVAWTSGAAMERQLKAQKIRELSSVTDIAFSTAQDFKARAAKGEMTMAEARTRALDAIRGMRYAGQEYFFIYDYRGYNLMHPFLPAFPGTDKSGLKDENGKFLIREMIEVSKSTGRGVVEYIWKKPGTTIPSLKIGYVIGDKDWELFYGTGVHIEDVEAIMADAWNQLFWSVGVVSVILVMISLLLMRSISAPLARLRNSLTSFANGEFSAPVDGTDRRDEIGAIARAVEALRSGLKQKAQSDQIASQVERARFENDRKRVRAESAQAFEQSVKGVTSIILERARLLMRTADQLVDSSRHTSVQVKDVSASAAEVLSETRTVATAASQLETVVAGVTQQMTEASTMAGAAVDRVRHASAAIRELSTSSDDIGRVVSLIEDIAAQTNLLALNATIEAARAGDAGRGFAVVASEVKALAGQTAKATQDISMRINQIQGATGDAVASIEEIERVISRLDEIALGISAATEEQFAATADISRAIGVAAGRTEEVSQDVATLDASTQHTQSVAMDVAAAARDLDEQARRLDEESMQLARSILAA